MYQQIVNDMMMKLGDRYTYDQRKEISDVALICLSRYTLSEKITDLTVLDNSQSEKLFRLFLVAKKIEGCTDTTLRYYRNEIAHFLTAVQIPLVNITTDDIRLYIARLSIERKVGKTTQDNTLRILKSFFGWLQAEEHIPRNPTLKIKKIKQEKRIKRPFSEIEIEKLRNGARDLRERAIIDILLSTGMRIGELHLLNRTDVNGDEIIVFGKGQKERYAYLNAKAQVSVAAYLETRDDDNEALFVGEQKPHNRLRIAGFETRLRELGKELGIPNVHPHRFRRTAATLALNRGMPIEQVQKMLGHEQIATTLIYAQAAQENVKLSHRKYMT